MFICKYCSKKCKNNNSQRNHERLCPNNKDRIYVSHTLGRPAWNKGLTKETSPSLLKASETMKKMGYGGWSKKASSNGGKAGGGYRENAGRSKKFRVLDSLGNEVCLQSTYELRCSILLNEMNIRWIRPKALKYSGKNYFADFFLIDYNIYLDPKNNYKAKLDAEKIRKVVEENDVKIFVLLNEHLTKEFLGSVIQ